MGSERKDMNEKDFTTQVIESSKDVIRFYNSYAPDWDSRFGNSKSTSAFYKGYLETVFKTAQFKSSDDVVDLGTGTGPYVDFIAPKVNSMLCIDGSDLMLKIFHAKHANVKNVRTHLADICEPIQGISFKADIVTCFGLIEHIVNFDVFLENCKSLLKPGGRVIIVASNGRSPWLKGLRLLWRKGRHCSKDHYYVPEELNQMVERGGFVTEASEYWGFFPAGTSDLAYYIFRTAEVFFKNTPLRCFAGGFISRYRMV
jgi:2-polyprenyl-3-methyl-5-hydroxy-6-metoxy-1,4-benzoquinol methylase